MTLTVAFRGGGECWWHIKARGRSWWVPGSLSLHDAMLVVYEDWTEYRAKTVRPR